MLADNRVMQQRTLCRAEKVLRIAVVMSFADDDMSTCLQVASLRHLSLLLAANGFKKEKKKHG